MPSLEEGKASIKRWWDLYGYDWIQELRRIMMKYRNLGHQWQFTQE
ncbi:MAG: hypothetical protein SWX82_23705 [Cyanobacteriota bacterium]|nr:hypothetical protein [Cyanobacteriota bacterium]